MRAWSKAFKDLGAKRERTLNLLIKEEGPLIEGILSSQSEMSADETSASIHDISPRHNSLATLPASVIRMILNFALEDKW